MSKRAAVIPVIVLVVAALLFFVINGRWTSWSGGRAEQKTDDALFDGGRRNAEVNESRTMLSKAELNLANVTEEVTVRVEIAYDNVELMQSLVTVAEEAVKAQTEAARVAERQVQQNAALASASAEAAAKTSSAKASLLEANLGLSLAQAN